MNKGKTFKIALGGICLALALIFMAGATIIPGVELTLFALSSVLTAIMLIETGVTGGAALYVAACILGFFLLPDKLALIPYAFLFGYYGILKYYLEKIKSGVTQIALKTFYFAAVICIGLLFFKSLIAGSIHLPDYPVAFLIAVGTLMLLLYDYIFTLIIRFYLRRFKGSNQDKFKLT